MRFLSLADIAETLKKRYPKVCEGLHRATVDTWVKAGKWDDERADLTKRGIIKAQGVEDDTELKELLENYVAENYDIDSKLRKESFQKLYEFIKQTPSNDLFSIRLMAEIFRTSTNNIIRLHEIAQGKRDPEATLDDLLRFRGEKID